ncbi:MAG: hypothetical protein CMQ26_00245 [Gammaproteobacteria bacterium]|nr:hypothetical protein [Gammaproteobacteria bacterium]
MVYNKKQRIVGTIVLMALVGVLFPVIFDGGDTFQAELESRIPPEPQFSLLPEPNPTRPVIIADADTDAGAEEGQSEISENDSQIISQSEEDEADLDLSPMLSGWSIRLGSFAEKQNAINLVERLHESEYKAYTREFNNSAGELVSVFVGPWIDKSIAEDYLSELEDKFRLAGDIVRYEVGSF